MNKAFLTRDGWPDSDNNWQATHQNWSKNDDNNDASEITEKFDALLTDNDDNFNNVTRDFLRRNHSSNCTVQHDLKYEKTWKKNENNDHSGIVSDHFKTNYELKWRYNGYDGCSEDIDDSAEGTDTYTCSSLISSSSSGIAINTPDDYKKIEEIFGIKMNSSAIEAHQQFQQWLQSISFP